MYIHTYIHTHTHLHMCLCVRTYILTYIHNTCIPDSLGIVGKQQGASKHLVAALLAEHVVYLRGIIIHTFTVHRYIVDQEPILRPLNVQLQRQRCSRLEHFP
jgi:hypothetical protein